MHHQAPTKTTRAILQAISKAILEICEAQQPESPLPIKRDHLEVWRSMLALAIDQLPVTESPVSARLREFRAADPGYPMTAGPGGLRAGEMAKINADGQAVRASKKGAQDPTNDQPAADENPNGAGTLAVGYSTTGNVILNLPHDMTGHILFTPDQACELASSLARQACNAAGETVKTAAAAGTSDPVEDEAIAALVSVARRPPIDINLQADSALQVMAMLQLALRHPGPSAMPLVSDKARMLKEILLMHLTEGNPLAEQLLRRGDDLFDNTTLQP